MAIAMMAVLDCNARVDVSFLKFDRRWYVRRKFDDLTIRTVHALCIYADLLFQPLSPPFTTQNQYFIYAIPWLVN
jgi:hypothetical protein